MRVTIEVHVLRLFERRFDGVIPGGCVRGIPIRHCGTGGYVQSIAVFSQFRAVKSHSCCGFFGVDFSGPPGTDTLHLLRRGNSPSGGSLTTLGKVRYRN